MNGEIHSVFLEGRALAGSAQPKGSMGLNSFQVLDINSRSYCLHCGLPLFLHLYFLQTNQSMHRHVYSQPLLIPDVFKLDLQRPEYGKIHLTVSMPSLPTASSVLSYSSLKFCLGPIKNTLEAFRESVKRLWESRKPFKGLVSRVLPPASETVSCASLDLFLFHCVTLQELPLPQIYLG